MKRYCYSTCVDGYKFHYDGRTDNPEEIIAIFKKGLENWEKELNDEAYQFRSQTRYKKGLRITDSQTKKVVFEEVHTSEEFGWKVIFEKVEKNYCTYIKHYFEKIN